jgi:hypothetical protein
MLGLNYIRPDESGLGERLRPQDDQRLGTWDFAIPDKQTGVTLGATNRKIADPNFSGSTFLVNPVNPVYFRPKA